MKETNSIQLLNKQLEYAEKLANLGYWTIDLQENTLFWSKEVYVIHGLKPEDYKPTLESSLNFYHRDDKGYVEKHVGLAIEKGESFQFELRLIRADNSIAYVRAKGECELGSNGQTIAVFGIFQDISVEYEKERQRTLAQQSHELYIRASYDGYWDWYIQDDYQYMSPRFWQMLGYLPEEKPHHPRAWQELVDQDDFALSVQKYEKHIENKGVDPYHIELRLKHKEGATITLLCRGHVVEWDSGCKPVRMVGTYTDITQQKRIEQQLLETKERFELAVQGASVGLWDWDIENESLYWSPRFKEIIGLEDSDADFTFEDFQKRLHPEDLDSVLKGINAHLEEGVEYKVDYRLRHLSGKYIWIHARGQATWDHTGKATRMAGSVDDITDQKNKSVELLEALIFQKLLMNASTDLFFVKNEKFQIVEANDAFINLYPADKRQKIIGYTTFEEYDEEQASQFLENDRKAFEEGLSEKIEEVHFPDGSQRFLLTKKERFVNSRGEPFILCCARDITAIKEAEQALIQANDELEEFAYQTSHDLRSPLKSSIGMLEQIEKNLNDSKPERAIDYMQIVKRSLVSLETLVSDILELTKTKNGEEQWGNVNVRKVVESALSKFSHMDNFDRLDIQLTIEGEECFSSKQSRVALIVENLLSNAIKYQDLGKDSSRVLVKITNETNVLYVDIRDNGLGIPEKYQHRVFSMFTRFHPKKSFGSGLGLYMVKKSVDVLGGSVAFKQTDYTCFTVKLPVANQ